MREELDTLVKQYQATREAFQKNEPSLSKKESSDLLVRIIATLIRAKECEEGELLEWPMAYNGIADSIDIDNTLKPAAVLIGIAGLIRL